MKLKTNFLIASTCCALLTATSAFAADADFTASVQLRQDLTVATVTNLIFPDQLAATANSVTVGPADTGHAELLATGTTGEVAVGTFAPADDLSLSCVVGSGSCTATTPAISVTGFTCGGAEKVAGSTCNYEFNVAQEANIAVGATETTTTENLDGTYRGTETFTINYQ